MNYLKLSLMFVLILLLNSCSSFEMEEALKKGVKFKNNSFCYMNNQRDIFIEFDFQVTLENNSNFRASSWLIFSRKFEDINEVKEYIIDNYSKTVDISFIFYRQGQINTPLHSVSLNYNNTEQLFANQEKGTLKSEPWKFKVPFTVNDNIFNAKEELLGCIRIKYADVDDYSYSDPVTIKYCDKDAPPPTKVEEVVLAPGKNIGPLVPATPIQINININGKESSAWVYPTTIDVNKYNKDNSPIFADIVERGDFKFPMCNWTLQSIIEIDSKFYKDYWSPMIYDLYKELMSKQNSVSYFSLILQGTADGGTKCKSISQMNQSERMIYELDGNYLRKGFNVDGLSPVGKYQYGDPVRNSDLPNLRSSFIKWAMKKSLVNKFNIGIVDGEVIPGRNPDLRKVTIYILQSKVNLGNDMSIYF